MNREQIQSEVNSDLATQKEILEKLGKTIQKDFTNALEWDKLEEAVACQLRVEVLEKLLPLLDDAELVEEGFLQTMLTARKWITGRLVGTSGSSGGRGPWDGYSTNPGSRRLAIVRCNVMRWEFRYIDCILKKLGLE